MLKAAALVVAIASVGVFVAGGFEAVATARLLRDGVTTKGRVVRIETSIFETNSSHGLGATRVESVKVAFQDESGGAHEVSAATTGIVTKGQEVDVVYLRDNPDAGRTSLESRWAQPRLLAFAGVCVAALAATLYLFASYCEARRRAFESKRPSGLAPGRP